MDYPSGKGFSLFELLGLSLSDALTGGVFCKTGRVFDFWDSLRKLWDISAIADRFNREKKKKEERKGRSLNCY